MAGNCSFDELIRLLQSKDRDATSLLFQRYAQRLIGLARTRLDERVRGPVDAEDVVQSVFRSFFSGVGKAQWQLQSEDSLWALLVVMTVRKCGRTAKRFLAAKRGGGVAKVEVGPADESFAVEPESAEPSPEEAAMLIETVEKLTADLDARERQILELSLQEYTVPEISEKVGRTTRTVYRALERIRGKLEDMRRQDRDE